MTRQRRALRIGFLHPDLGLGGSERLVVDAARHLQTMGHRVTMFTAHHDRLRSFEETRDGTLTIRVHGDFIPSHVAHHLRAPCAIARMAYLTSAAALTSDRFDVIFCDVIAHTVPLLKRLTRAKIVFYCHFPDQRLPSATHWLYRLYRAPIDGLEAVGISAADRVLVNSRFTAAAFRDTFPRLHDVPVQVLYPGVDSAPYGSAFVPVSGDAPRETGILSINRYERKKDLGLAIEALAHLRGRLPAHVFGSLRLVLAGDYDDRWREHHETFAALQALAAERGVAEHVVFKRSCTDAERVELLARCRCVVYTPANEHFGFGPIEAMAAGRPVVAVASGGPLETVRHEETGFLCPPTPTAFADALTKLIANPEAADRMGKAGRLHVEEHFSLAAFGARLEAIMQDLVASPRDADRAG